jgi:hypothetical protein
MTRQRAQDDLAVIAAALDRVKNRSAHHLAPTC